MTTFEAKLIDALLANVKLRQEGERLIAAYVAPESDRATIINGLIRLFDGPVQREAELLTREVLADGEKLRELQRRHPPTNGE
jgi:hypothetical protein